jgi:hypothetical protein
MTTKVRAAPQGPSMPQTLKGRISSRARRSLLALVVAFSGCAGYRFGNSALYPPDVHTVYVPVFESDSFRRGLGERLTEAVVKQIELKTPYKVVNSPDADSVLVGKIQTEAKRVVVEDQNDQPRENNISMSVQVAWLDRKGDYVGATTGGKVPLPPDAVTLTANTEFVPEYGQSSTTSMEEVIDRIAVQIVSLMEIPW